MSPSKIQ